MKLLWWKVYFWLNVALLAFVVVAEFSEPTGAVGLFLADVALYTISLIGVFSYFSQKRSFDQRFWKYFFWFNIVYTAAYLLYVFAPNAPFISYLSFLAYGEQSQDSLLLFAMVGLLLSIPAIYATYQLSKGQYLEPKTKEQERKDATAFRWGIVQTALWGYSIVFLIIVLLLSFVPTSESSSGDGSFDIIYSIFIFSPILLFWLWVAAQHKMYKWNWWKVTLLLNSLLFSGLIVFGSFFFEPVSTAAVESEGPDIIGLLQFAIILAGLVVFGREQLHKPLAHQPVEIPSEKKTKEE
jgi:hypothetical protein